MRIADFGRPAIGIAHSNLESHPRKSAIQNPQSAIELPALAGAPAAAFVATTIAIITATPIFTRLGFIHNDVSPVVFLTVELRDRIIRAVFICHPDKPEPAGTACLSIEHYISRFHSSGRSKVIL